MNDKIVNIKTGKAVSKHNRIKTSDDAWRWRALMEKINEEGWGIAVQDTIIDKTLIAGVISVLDEEISAMKKEGHKEAGKRYRQRRKK